MVNSNEMRKNQSKDENKENKSHRLTLLIFINRKDWLSNSIKPIIDQSLKFIFATYLIVF